MKILLLLVTTLPVTVLNGWAFLLLWGWFIAPIFSAPLLTLGQAIGFGMVASLLTYRPSNETELDLEETMRVIIQSITYPLFVVLFGLIVKQFI